MWARNRFSRTRRGLRNTAVVSALLVAFFVATAGNASASLVLLQPDPDIPVTFFGTGGYSADGLGQNEPGGTLQADVPAGSQVVQAYLYGTYFFIGDDIPEDQDDIDFDGTMVTLSELGVNEPPTDLRTGRADVTSQVASKVGSGGGITNFAINNDPVNLDGVGLVVIYNNPAMPNTTIGILDGEASSQGDSVNFDFAEPIDKSLANFSATMSLGSGFSFQGTEDPATHVCGTGDQQFSTVDVNGGRLTSCAGNHDDGAGNNGALITVGGVGDSRDNPADPNQQAGDGGDPRVTDDELYDIAGFMEDGDTSLTIDNANPSNDDNLFLAVIAIAGGITEVPPENCGNGVDDDGDGLADSADPDCGTGPQCAEDGLALLAPSGVASGTVHGLEPTVQGALGSLIPTIGNDVHNLNCGLVVPLEDQVDALVSSLGL